MEPGAGWPVRGSVVPMKSFRFASAVILGWAVAASASSPPPIANLRAIHALTNPEASHMLPVAFQATVTYFRPYENTLFVQDGDVAIYVEIETNAKLSPGDRVLIRGTTEPSFRPFVLGTSISVVGHGAVPPAPPATFDELIRGDLDCQRVTVRGHVRTADLATSANVESTSLQMMTEGGEVDAIVDSNDREALKNLLDAEVEVTGAESGQFDGKMQQTGILVHVSSLADVRVIERAAIDPWSIPVTPMDRILSGYRVKDLTQRVRVHGTITYYQPGSMLVLQDGERSLWVMTQTQAPLLIGDRADAIGFPAVHDGFLTLTSSEIQEKQEFRPVVPKLEDAKLLTSSKHIFDLVSIDATAVAAVRGAAQDEYVLSSEGQLFSAIYRHPILNDGNTADLPLMKEIPLGATVRVTGICMLERSNPFNGQVPFNLLMRSFDDIVVTAAPSKFNVRNLTYAVSLLLLIVLAVTAWGWTMKVKVRQQTEALSARIAADAALERRMAELELGRSRILEDINGARPLAEILEQITELASFRLYGAACWCEVAGGARLGAHCADEARYRIVRMEIPARSGPALGVLYAGFEIDTDPGPDEQATLSVAAKLAALAIENRRLYADLHHRSEFDLLTDIHNRFSLEKHLLTRIDEARENASIFGLVYIDLDQFKQVNDLYGHRVGDLYLQEVAVRMKRQLRTGDMLARLGGDEFAALLPNVGSRAHAEEIAQRLERSFDQSFAVEGYVLQGSASVGIAIYPEDGTTKDVLLSAADANMYVTKHTRHEVSESLEMDARHSNPFGGRT
jgi:diguanylate cyclase (GGDEF)-like protein